MPRSEQDRCRLGLAINPVDDGFGVASVHTCWSVLSGAGGSRRQFLSEARSVMGCDSCNSKHEGLLSLGVLNLRALSRIPGGKPSPFERIG